MGRSLRSFKALCDLRGSSQYHKPQNTDGKDHCGTLYIKKKEVEEGEEKVD